MRPDFAPAEASKDRTGILAWSYQLTDDKTLAIVHYVSAQRAAIEPIVSDKRPDTKVFESGKHSREMIEREMRKYKKDFNLDTIAVRGN